MKGYIEVFVFVSILLSDSLCSAENGNISDKNASAFYAPVTAEKGKRVTITGEKVYSADGKSHTAARENGFLENIKKAESPINRYSSKKIEIVYLMLPVDGKRYISLKNISETSETAESYGKMYLLLKTLRNPVRHCVQVHIDKSRQRMYVYLDDEHLYRWRVSTARRGYWTPNGFFRPYALHRIHYSRKYHHSPMPWSVFFKGGYAIHGTNALRHLGRPASHGCVRLHPQNAKKLYDLIRRYGMQHTRIVIRG
jgi:hypothetical protein